MFLVHGQWGNYLWVDPGDGGTVVVLCWLGGWGGVAAVDLDCCVAGVAGAVGVVAVVAAGVAVVAGVAGVGVVGVVGVVGPAEAVVVVVIVARVIWAGVGLEVAMVGACLSAAMMELSKSRHWWYDCGNRHDHWRHPQSQSRETRTLCGGGRAWCV
jgi:hypothetical protein